MYTDYRAELKVLNMIIAVQHPTNSNICILDSSSKAYLFDLKALAYPSGTAGVLALANNGGAAAFIDSNRVFVWLQNGNMYSVDFNGSGSVTTLTSQSATPLSYTFGPNQNRLTASQITLKKAMAIGSSLGQMITVDNSGGGTPITAKFTATGSKRYLCIIPHPTNGNYIAGTDDGFIHELTFTGTIVKQFQLPLTGTRSGTSIPGTALLVHSLSMDPTGTYLYVMTTQGFRFKYSYATPTLLEQMMVSVCSSGFSPMMSEIVNNQFFQMLGSSGPTNGQFLPLNLMRSGSLQTIELDALGIGPSWQNMRSMGINAAAGVGWIGVSGGFDNSGQQVIIFGLDGLTAPSPSVLGRMQVPAGTDVNYRSVILNYLGQGMSYVESDTNISAGSQPLSIAIDNSVYYEFGINGSQGVDEVLGFRKFQS